MNIKYTKENKLFINTVLLLLLLLLLLLFFFKI